MQLGVGLGTVGSVIRNFFYITGNFAEIPCYIKSPPGGIALRRKGRMSLKRPAAGGESCFAGFFLTPIFSYSNIIFSKCT